MGTSLGVGIYRGDVRGGVVSCCRLLTYLTSPSRTSATSQVDHAVHAEHHWHQPGRVHLLNNCKQLFEAFSPCKQMSCTGDSDIMIIPANSSQVGLAMVMMPQHCLCVLSISAVDATAQFLLSLVTV